MKKLYLMLCVLLGCAFSIGTSAQSEFTKLATIQIGGAVSTIEADTWYFVYQARNVDQNAGTYDFCMEGDLPSPNQGGVLTDRGIGNQVFKMNASNLLEAQPASEYAAYVVKFLPIDGKDGAYNIQFGTGRYMTPPTGTTNGSTFTTAESIYDAGEFNIYNIDPEQPGPMGFNVYEYAGRIDNNGTDHNVVVWGSGKHETVGTSNSIWSVHEVIWGEGDEYEIALSELINRAYDLEQYGNGYFPTGTEPGQYDADAVAAFEQVLEAGIKADEPGAEPLTLEQIAALKQALEEAYQAVLDSKVPYILPDGYYRIRGALIFSNEVNIGEVDDAGNPVTETRDVYKYMYSDLNNGTIRARWQTPDDLGTDCTALWLVTRKEGGYDIVNMATEGRFNTVATSTAVTLSTNVENLMALDHVVNIDGVNYVNIRVATQEANARLYLHMGGHGNGTGVSGNIVGWENSYSNGNFGATEWTFEPVSQEEADAIVEAYAPSKDHEQMVSNYKAMVADVQPKLVIAKDISVEIFDDQPLITSVEQLSSPYTEESEGSLDQLLDGRANNGEDNFWHSNWTGGSVAAHTHYLQVALPDDDHPLITIQFTRRNVASDHITKWGVWGSNNPDAPDEEWVELASLNTPYSSSTETIVTDLFETQGMQYLRFYADATTTGRGYWHMAEFQLYPGQVIDPATSQYKVMGDIATNLEKVIADQADIEDEDLSPANYNALKEAYDAFIAKFVDPAPLREAIETAEAKADGIVVGSQPGFWERTDVANSIKAAIEAAKAYDVAGDYSAEQSTAHIEALQAQADAVAPAAIGIKTDKWYRLRFGTEAEFEQYGWSFEAGNPTTTTVDEQVYTINEALWGKYVTAGRHTTLQPAEGVTANDVEALESAEEAPMGTNLFLDDAADISVPDMSLFRFVAVADTAYMLQHKGSNLFIKAAGTSGAVSLSPHPSLFKVRAIGYGLNALAAESITGQAQSFLHAQVAQNIMVTWNVDHPGSRSGFFIEEAADVDAAYDGQDFFAPLQFGSVHMFCFPVPIQAADGMYAVSKADGTDITLAPIKEAEAGRPFVFINGDTEQYVAEEEEADAVALKHGYELVTEPDTTAIIRGTFTNLVVGNGVIVAEGNKLAVAKRSNTSVAANRAYIKADEKYDLEAEVTMTIDMNGQDGINAAIANVARRGELYTTDGRLVQRNANLNTLRHMPKGIYILNGTKVTVK